MELANSTDNTQYVSDIKKEGLLSSDVRSSQRRRHGEDGGVSSLSESRRSEFDARARNLERRREEGRQDYLRETKAEERPTYKRRTEIDTPGRERMTFSSRDGHGEGDQNRRTPDFERRRAENSNGIRENVERRYGTGRQDGARDTRTPYKREESATSIASPRARFDRTWPSSRKEAEETPAVPEVDDVDLEKILREADKVYEQSHEKTSKLEDNMGKSKEKDDANTVAAVVELASTPEANQKKAELLWRVQNHPIQLTGISGEPFQPRYLSEEGFFVANRPQVWGSTLRKVEHRVFHDHGKEWFALDGHLNNERNPVKHHFQRNSTWFDPKALYLHTKYVEPSSTADGINFESEKTYQLEVDILSIKLQDHPLFCREDLLASQLTLLYQEHIERKKLNLWEFYNEKLQVLQEHLGHLRKNPVVSTTHRGQSSSVSRILQTSPPEAEQVQNFNTQIVEQNALHAEREKKLRAYIKETRKIRDAEEIADNLLVKKIVSVWTEIKKLRQDQGFNATAIKLVVQKQNTDADLDKERLQKQLESELKEMQEDHEADYAGKLHEYHMQMKQVANGEKADETMPSEASANRVVPNIPVFKEFDQIAAKNEILARYKATKRKPGAPIVIPTMYYDSTEITTDPNVLPLEEKLRRLEIQKYQLHFKLFANNKLVTKTRSKALKATFAVEFNETVTLQLVKWPESLRLQLYSEYTGVGNKNGKETYLGEAALQIPVGDAGTGEPDLFQLRGGVPFSHSWKKQEQQEEEQETALHGQEHFVTGLVKVHLGWGTDEERRILAPPLPPGMKKLLLKGPTPLVNITSTQTLKDWLTAVDNNPNDPRNENIQLLIKGDSATSLGASLLDSKHVYSLIKHERDLLFEDPNEPETKREKLIKLRQEKSLQHSKPIPFLELEITNQHFHTVEVKPEDEDLPAAQELNKRNFLKEVRAHQVKIMLEEQKNLQPRISEILKMPTVAMIDIGSIIKKILQPKRKLKPQRKERIGVAVLPQQSCQLLVQIKRGFNIPSRKDRSGNEGQVVPFVQVDFQSQQERTRDAEGSSPQWNETLIFPFNPPGNDFSARNLSIISENVYFNVFDEMTIDINKDDRKKDEIHQRRNRRWLGSFSIPFSAIYQNLKVEGMFKVSKPLVSLGYVTDGSKRLKDNTNSTMISVYATLNPPLQRPPVPKVEQQVNIFSRETPSFLRYASNWVNKVKSNPQCANRRIQSLAVDLTGRYVRPQKPPAELEGNELAVIRFVSLVPFLEDSITFIGRTNVWNTSRQFLEMRAGDWEEHAILLCNYFLYLKKDAYVCLGTGKEGEAAHTLVIDGSKITFYNACTGEVYDSSDMMSPFLDVACVFNNQNIFANVQKVGTPSMMKWNFEKTNQWRPFFSRQFPSMNLESVQVDTIDYQPTQENFASQLESEIEGALNEGIRNWRASQLTRWNRPCSKILESLLQKCEQAVVGQATTSEEEHARELARYAMTYQISGFPMNITYTDLEDVVDAVYKTNVHRNDDPGAEFAMAVKVVPYPNRICSIWIYIVSFIPR